MFIMFIISSTGEHEVISSNVCMGEDQDSIVTIPNHFNKFKATSFLFTRINGNITCGESDVGYWGCKEGLNVFLTENPDAVTYLLPGISFFVSIFS